MIKLNLDNQMRCDGKNLQYHPIVMKNLFKIFCLISVLFSFSAYGACEYPRKVEIPNGATSSSDEFKAGYQMVRQWIEDMNDYMECIDKDTVAMISMLKINQQHTPEAEDTIIEHQDKKYNAAVEDQQKVAELLNIEVRAYKAKEQ